MSRKLIPLLASTLLALVSFVTPASTTYASNTSTSSATKPCTRSVIASVTWVQRRRNLTPDGVYGPSTHNNMTGAPSVPNVDAPTRTQFDVVGRGELEFTSPHS